MASPQQSRIQSYLERNKIGPLFEKSFAEQLDRYRVDVAHIIQKRRRHWNLWDGFVFPNFIKMENENKRQTVACHPEALLSCSDQTSEGVVSSPSTCRRDTLIPMKELMTKLITETPDHPIPFLIDHLQTKQDSPGKLHRAFSGSAALWAQSSPDPDFSHDLLSLSVLTENKNTRREYSNFEKPWQITPKKPKKSKSDLAVSSISPPSPESKSLPRSVECPSWDWRESRDFDELSHILQESKKLGKALESLSRSIAISDELDQHFLGYNAVLRPRVVGEWVGREDNDADPLAAEMLHPPVPRAKTEVCWSGENSPVRSLKMEIKSKGLREQQQHHKKLLAAMLSQDSFDSVNSPASSVVEEEIEDEDDAMELLEAAYSFTAVSLQAQRDEAGFKVRGASES
ncbi:hypothetical protein CCH79_00004219 [Gambusia affinis]|uniref:Uncharacterized protein n=1 Tax=Gambusia affinis TaxID=33528 RepID=A0A315V553_GAMAF|nr:hypothetical protein CCH79_00004219 [Gambusia affinis]